MSLIRYNCHTNRVWVLNQRIHHGPVGLVGGTLLVAVAHGHYRWIGALLLAWGLNDLHDAPIWFRRDG